MNVRKRGKCTARMRAGARVSVEVGGIFDGMISAKNGHEILDAVGQEFQLALINSVEQARADLRDFQEFRPGWFPTFTQRFISNFIHERVWAELVRRIDASPDSTIIDEEPVREIGWMNSFNLRVKRHKAGDVIAAFPRTARGVGMNRRFPWMGLMSRISRSGTSGWTVASGQL